MSSGDAPGPGRARPRRLRSCERGAAMVESIILVVTLIIIDTGMLFICGACDATLTAMRDARSGVWTHATKACRGNASSGTTTVAISGSDPSLARATQHMARARSIAQGQTLQKPLETELRVTSATSRTTAAGHGSIFATFAGLDVTTTTRVMCNERQEPISEGDIRATINSLYGRWL